MCNVENESSIFHTTIFCYTQLVKVNFSSGAQQISYLYEGYGNSSNNYGSDYTYLLPGTYGNFLPGDYEFVVRQGDDEFPSTQSVRYEGVRLKENDKLIEKSRNLF